MNMLEKMKNLFSPEELKQVQEIPTQVNGTSFNSVSHEDDENDLTDAQWAEHCFDMYAQEYHNLPPEERDEFMRGQDTYWMMQ
ncbi:hypothetical protein ACB087_01985 [Vibrio sp. VNB-15]